ncbi:MAG: hypothetical protein K0Q72_4545, partial [Armatimonadetes bacterium]|nr:hypothetical protein [Armatimonadota bacterium]
MRDDQTAASEIMGVVIPFIDGSSLPPETGWTLSFRLQPWRWPDGRLEESPLEVRQTDLSEERLDELMEALNSYDVVRVRLGRIEADPTLGSFAAELLELLDTEYSDPELSGRAAELQQPVTVEAPSFGTLTLDRGLNWYEATATWNGREIRLHLSRDGATDDQELFALARQLWEQEAEWEQRMRRCAVEKLLALKNDAWLDEDEEDLTADEFAGRMVL